MPPIEPLWLTVADLIDINADEVAETGEPHQVRSTALLESAAARPRNLFHYEREEDVVRLAVALVFGLVKNHPFVQGNKRTAHTAAIMFIEMNGYRWIGEDDASHWGKMVIDLEGRDLSEARFANILRLSISSAT